MREQKQVTCSLAGSREWGSWSHIWDEGGEGPGFRPGGWAGCLFPLGGAVCRNHDQHPAFAPGCSEIPLGFWSICILLLIIFPNCTCMQLLLAPYNFFVFWCLMCLLSRYTHCSKLSQPVSFPTEGSTPLFLTVKGTKLSSIKTSPCWTGTTELSLPSRCRSPSQGPTWIWATLHWNRLYSLSHHECYFKLVDATDTKSIKRLNKQGLERKKQ